MRQRIFFWVCLAAMLASGLPGLAQESGGWRKADEPGEADKARPAEAQLVLPAGTWIKVRVDQPLSSNRNQPGDAFTATLSQPLIVDGLVVARSGQTIAGRVAEAEKAGRVKGGSRLGLELTEISLADGHQLPVRTELIAYAGGASKGRDATAIGTTTGAGAAIGAAAGGGFGSGMGAIAGAAASTIGVLVTRGRATKVYPESVLTFRTVEPLYISTRYSGQAFQPVRQEDYERTLQQRRDGPPPSLRPWAPYFGGYYYPYSPFFYGPRTFFRTGPRFYSGRGFSRRGRF